MTKERASLLSAVFSLCMTFFLPQQSNAALPQQAAGDSRWVLHNGGDSSKLPNPPVSCHTFEYFVDASDHSLPGAGTGTDHVRTEHRGEIDGFGIYDVFHRFDGNMPVFLKIILVERKPREFCEIYQEVDNVGGAIPEPSYIVQFDSEKVLATHDRKPGTGGYYEEAYWTFDRKGPIFLDLGIIDSIKAKLLPAGMTVNKGGGFRIERLSYDMGVWQTGDANCCPTGGSIHIQFALRNHQLVVVSREYRESCPEYICGAAHSQ